MPPRLVHVWAILTAAATLPLLALGAEVTSKGVGMVDPRGLRTPWYFFEGWDRGEQLGWLIEHGHRLAGWNIGLCVIILVALLFLQERRGWVRALGVLALLMVIGQGALGIFRIELNALLGKTLALIHGLFAPLVVAVLVSIAVLTSPTWFRPGPRSDENLRRWSLIAVAVIFGQLALGGLVRHKDFFLSARLHVLGAVGVALVTSWLTRLLWERSKRWTPGAVLLTLLVGLQLVFGVETWLRRFYMPSEWAQLEPLPMDLDPIRSLHYVTGAAIFATATSIAIYCRRGETA